MDDAATVLDQYASLVRKIAGSAISSSSTIDVEDLCQVGNMAVLNAVKSYDPTYGANIKSYVAKAVRRAIYNEAARFLGIFTVDHRTTEIGAKVKRWSDAGHSDEEIAVKLNESMSRNFDENHVRDLRLAYVRRHYCSTEYKQCERADDVESLEILLENIPRNENERYILDNKILGKQSTQTVASALGLSRRKVSELEKTLITRIRESIYND